MTPLCPRSIQIQPVDWTVGILLVFEAPSIFFSQYRANSFHFFTNLAAGILVYFATRLVAHTLKWVCAIAAALGVAGLYLALSTLYQFSYGMQKLAAVGFTDLVAFRAQFASPIHGWLAGEAFTALLLALPWTCASVAYLWLIKRSAVAILFVIPPALICAALCISLSRAVVWALFVFCIGALALMIVYGVLTRKTALRMMGAVLGTLVVILLCESAWYPGIFNAYLGQQTTQVRSTRGRLEVWRRSRALVEAHPLWGVGSSNAALFLLSFSDVEDTTGFVGRTFSLPVQILVEKGAMGCAAYGVFLIFAGLQFHWTMTSKQLGNGLRSSQRRQQRGQQSSQTQRQLAHKAMKCVFAAGLIAILFRELTYSSILEHTLTVAVALALVALACSDVGAQL